MTDNITLPRDVAKMMFNALLDRIHGPYKATAEDEAALAALDAALAEPPAKTEPVAWMHEFLNPFDEEDTAFRTAAEMRRAEKMQHVDRAVWTPLYAAPPEPDAKPEPATNKEIDAEWLKIKPVFYPMDNLSDFRDGFRAAEKFHSIKKEDKT
jgi:hypothetical protein